MKGVGRVQACRIPERESEPPAASNPVIHPWLPLSREAPRFLALQSWIEQLKLKKNVYLKVNLLSRLNIPPARCSALQLHALDCAEAEGKSQGAFLYLNGRLLLRRISDYCFFSFLIWATSCRSVSRVCLLEVEAARSINGSSGALYGWEVPWSQVDHRSG